MAGPNLTRHTPIASVQNRDNATPFTNAIAEAAGQTFQYGSPVQLVGGYVQVWDGATVAAGILGVAESFGQNLATAGGGFPTTPFGPVSGSIAIQTYGQVINVPQGVNIALGTPVAEGRTLFILANDANVFEAIFDNAAGAVAADYTPTQATIGTNYGLTADGNGGWYVDKNKTGGSAVLKYIGVNPIDGYTVNARVRFIFLTSAAQFPA